LKPLQLLSKHKAFFQILLAATIIFSWPLIYYPLTDGDIVNWAQFATQIHSFSDILTAPSDQGHGPLMVWTGAFFLSIFGNSFFVLNLFNLLMGLLGITLMYYFSLKFFNENTAKLSAFLGTSTIAFVYLTRTPMYDWPATILYFAFCGFYMLYLKENKTSQFSIALLCIGIGSTSRFSICLGLAGFFIILSNLIQKRSLLLMIRDGVILTLSIAFCNTPWLLLQLKSDGGNFLKTFIYDNTGRYVKSTRPNAIVRKDFYGFSIYVLLGLLPYTFAFIGSFFQKEIFKRFKENKNYLLLLCGFLPCFLLFSFSGHTKLARYIAYVFPFILVLLADMMVRFDLMKESYRRKCGRMTLFTMVLLAILLVQQTLQFKDEAEQSFLFVGGVVFMLFSLLFLAYYTVTKKHNTLANNPEKLIWANTIIYMIFFSILTVESLNAEFLLWVRNGIESCFTTVPLDVLK
jgi:4-amino-4-deoxy-L-arabinose transferase-like glycosyltransferase